MIYLENKEVTPIQRNWYMVETNPLFSTLFFKKSRDDNNVYRFSNEFEKWAGSTFDGYWCWDGRSTVSTVLLFFEKEIDKIKFILKYM